MRVLLVLAVALGLTGCTPVAERCRDIWTTQHEVKVAEMAMEYRLDSLTARTRNGDEWADAVASIPVKAAIPPRPSELAWYAEHCWDGKPR